MALGKRLINTGAVAACNTDSVQAFGADAAYSSNVALYQLDGNANDTTGNYNGTASNVTYATGYIGNAAEFNGSSSKIVVSKNVFTNTNVFSLSIWFKTDGTVSTTQFLMDTTGGANSGFQFYITNSKLKFFNRSGTTNSTVLTSTTSVDDSSWHNAIITQNSSGFATMYIDGQVEVASTNLVTVLPSHNLDLHLGGYYTSTLGLNGDIDQVRIFDKAISAEDVATLYAETSSTASNTNPFSEGAGVALYTMDYDASEASGYYDGTPTDVTFGVGGKINYGARFNGSSSYINLGTGSSGLSGLLNQKVSQSVSFWMNTSYTGISGNSIIYSVYAGGGISLNIYYLTNGTLYFLTRYTNSDTTFTTTQTFNDSQWHHIAVTIDVSSLERKIYIDNSLVSTQALSSNAYGGSGTTGVALGTNGNFNTQYYKGDLDQVRIFSKALDSTEVSTLWNSGNGETACVYTATTTDNDYPTTNLAYYKLDNSAEDEKGSYDGTETNVEYRFGRFGQAAVFNGSSSKIDTSLSLDTNNISGGSISFWFNTSQTTPVQILIGSQTAQNGGSYGTSILLGASTGASASESISVWDYNGGTTSAFYTEGGSSFYQDGNWHHLVITSTSSTKNIYIDGVSQTISYTGSGSASANLKFTDIQIGATLGYTGTNYFDGSIDQVRIFSTALSASQVTELYNEKPETDTSTFKTVLYTGNDSTQYVSNVGFEPDLVWVKNRTGSFNHVLVDSIRGANNLLFSDTTAAALTSNTTLLSSIDELGFTVGYDGTDVTNGASNNYVAWVFKGGGGDAVSNTDGTATTSVSASDKGFSIVKWTSDGTTQTMGHGLNIDGTATTPELIITKATNVSRSWYVWANGFTTGEFLLLNSNAAKSSVSNLWGSLPTSTVFSYDGSQINNNDQVVAYCFASVSGVSKIGSYTGNGTGKTIYLDSNGDGTGTGGFQPSFVMIKCTSDSQGWSISDSARSPNNPVDAYLSPNSSFMEQEGYAWYDLNYNSNGFTVNGSDNFTNGLNETYIYLAFK